MSTIEIDPKRVYSELLALQARERGRLISEALQGHELTRVQRRQLEIELENTTRFVEGELTPTDDSGAVLRDDHGWPVSIMDFIKSTAEIMFKQSTPAAEPQVKAPQSPDELYQRMKEATSLEERIKISQAFKDK